MISYYSEKAIFSITTKSFCYQFKIEHNRYLIHLYSGRRFEGPAQGYTTRTLGENYSSLHPDPDYPDYSPDMALFEFPTSGKGDYRIPAFEAVRPDGSPIFNFIYHSYRIKNSLPQLKGLPSVYAENEDKAQTLEIICKDKRTGLEIHIMYGVLPDFDTVIRWVEVVNNGKEQLKLAKIFGFCLELPDSNFDFISLQGAWAREKHQKRVPIVPGVYSIGSRRGISSHQYNPAAAICRPETTENSGEVYGFALLYSGNFRIEAEAGPYGTLRCLAGIHDELFSWNLEPGGEFTTPQTVMIWSENGLNGLSNGFHDLIRSRLIRGKHGAIERPVLINNWEATYFNYNHNTLIEIADAAEELGIELFVLDDGWFGARNNDNSALGDWTVNQKKLPWGLEGLSREIRKRGLQFGLWVEPEMISPNSELMRKHPEWVMGSREEHLSLGRHQLVLDLTRKEVQDYLIETLTSVFENAALDYVKWDANRGISEMSSAGLPPSRQGEIAHRYVLGLYHVLDTLVKRFPNILFEGCAGGGGRFDAGMLAYMQQYWTSDNTDAVSRLEIQSGTSLFYPAVTMGSHVSAVPNHQVGRFTSLHFRGTVAMGGNLGYELDVRNLDAEEKKEISEQIAFYKKWRATIQFGTMYRLEIVNGNQYIDGKQEYAWLFVSKEKKYALLLWFSRLHEQSTPSSIILLKGLQESCMYKEKSSNCLMSGSELMYRGILSPAVHGDFVSWRGEFISQK